ncbi:MAG: hypothetical protein ABIG95_05380 [Candidatus Woesearchaeota archaeon]
MVIGTKELLRLVKEQNLIENLCERELQNPEGTGFDLRIGKVFKLKGESFLGETERKTPQTKLIAAYDPKQKKSVILNPGEYLLTESIEKINLPFTMFGIIKPRSTLFRSGVVLRAGVIDPGYSGQLHPLLHNVSNCPMTIELGARYINIFFHKVEGEIHSAYRGQWQGGRVSTDGHKEKQI